MNNVMGEIKSLCDRAKLAPLYQALQLQEASSEWINSSFSERLLGLLEAQVDNEATRKISRLRKSAHLRWPQASLADFKTNAELPVTFAKLKDIGQCNWIKEFRHIVITGPTGAGKTHLACAIGDVAIMQGFSVLYYHYQKLIRDLKIAEKAGDEELEKLRKKLASIRVLIVDDWGIQQLSSVERHLLFELIELRDQNGSLIITSQYAPVDWYDAFSDKTVADSTMDRILPYAVQLRWSENASSYRDLRGRELINKANKKGGQDD